MKEVAFTMEKTFLANREDYLANPDASEYLGGISKRMYSFIKKDLVIPMDQSLVDHLTLGKPDGRKSSNRPAHVNTGTRISQIYQALKDERLVVLIMACLKKAVEANWKQKVGCSKL
jgi:phenylalanine ammonia-lyase